MDNVIIYCCCIPKSKLDKKDICSFCGSIIHKSAKNYHLCTHGDKKIIIN